MAQKYDIVLDGQLGERRGTLVFTENHGCVHGIFSLLGFDNPVSGEKQGQHLKLTHKLRTVFSTLICQTLAEFQGDELSGVVFSGNRRFGLHGKKQQKGAQNDEISEQD